MNINKSFSQHADRLNNWRQNILSTEYLHKVPILLEFR